MLADSAEETFLPRCHILLCPVTLNYWQQ